MPNLHRGEIAAHLDGKQFRLCLTLGALAELESAFGDEDMLALAQRFEKGRLSARDCVRIRQAPVVPALPALRLRQDGVDTFDERRVGLHGP